MSLIEKLKKDKIEAMKGRDSFRNNLLSVVIAGANSMAKDSKNDSATDEQVISVIKKIKKGSVEIYELNKNEDSKNEIEILDSYLPSQLSDDDLRNIVFNFVEKIPSDDRSKSMGKVMKYLKEDFDGQYDGKVAGSIVKEVINLQGIKT